MTIEEGNAYIAKFLGIEKKEGKGYILPTEYQQILKVKTTSKIMFNESFDLLFLAIKKIASIKDLWITTQEFQENGCYVCLYYKAQMVEGEWKNAKFSCERQKPIDKFKQAIWEVISTFCGWYFDNKDCQTEIEYTLNRVEYKEDNNIVYMEPKEVICPKCEKIYELNQ